MTAHALHTLAHDGQSDAKSPRPSGGGRVRLHEILEEFYERYRRPILIAETGIEDEARPEWFRYVFEQAEIAKSAGVPIHGICLYPIVNHPGWNDNRHCHNGLWDYPNSSGEREIYQPLVEEIRRVTIGDQNRKSQSAAF